MTRLEYAYKTAQIDLACLDTLMGDHEDYAVCLRLAGQDSSGAAIHQMFETHNACAFECRDRETRDERYERWGMAA